jgi:hypothetical protein
MQDVSCQSDRRGCKERDAVVCAVLCVLCSSGARLGKWGKCTGSSFPPSNVPTLNHCHKEERAAGLRVPLVSERCPSSLLQSSMRHKRPRCCSLSLRLLRTSR